MPRRSQATLRFSARVLTARERREYLRSIVADAMRLKSESPLARYYTTGVEQADLQSVLGFLEYLSKKFGSNF